MILIQFIYSSYYYFWEKKFANISIPFMQLFKKFRKDPGRKYLFNSNYTIISTDDIFC